METVKIIDVIKHQNQYAAQTFIVVDKYPKFLYEKRGNWLIGEDSGFFNFYRYEKCRGFEAFAGRKFTIPLKDGTKMEADGQWWDDIPMDYRGLVGRHGVNTIKALKSCNVFMSTCFDPEILKLWLEKNEPSNNYNKYSPRNKDYMKHSIVSQWESTK